MHRMILHCMCHKSTVGAQPHEDHFHWFFPHENKVLFIFSKNYKMRIRSKLVDLREEFLGLVW